jgi:4-carboxymuconolactone decarboxylase
MISRLPALKPIDLDDAQGTLYESLIANEVPWTDRSGVQAMEEDGSLLGPFNPLLFSPDVGTAQIEVFRADKRSTSLSPRVHEIVVLTVGAAWNAEYELYAHSAIAKLTGIPDSVVQALASGRLPDFQSEQEAIAYEFTQQLTQDHWIDPGTYARAERAFGQKGLVDMVLLIGLYLTTCAIINAFEVPVPETAAFQSANSAGPQYKSHNV